MPIALGLPELVEPVAVCLLVPHSDVSQAGMILLNNGFLLKPTVSSSGAQKGDAIVRGHNMIVVENHAILEDRGTPKHPK